MWCGSLGGVPLRCRPRHLTAVQNDEASQNSPRVASKRDVANKPSPSVCATPAGGRLITSDQAHKHDESQEIGGRLSFTLGRRPFPKDGDKLNYIHRFI
ncbi:hypothetical protein AVEN_153905-1 [Araneus ventricosus]|uniref:Uncharacterized protein n=1 Tax=Araneus ventricosus TaxID=182803 RepID=A0A4Y2F6J6_ARAVE|nr:hypothetical protein AVEN_153905-1 [Araneus ventricosus]